MPTQQSRVSASSPSSPAIWSRHPSKTSTSICSPIRCAHNTALSLMASLSADGTPQDGNREIPRTFLSRFPPPCTLYSHSSLSFSYSLGRRIAGCDESSGRWRVPADTTLPILGSRESEDPPQTISKAVRDIGYELKESAPWWAAIVRSSLARVTIIDIPDPLNVQESVVGRFLNTV